MIAPGAGAVGGGAAEQRGAVVDLDRAVGFRRAGQRQGVVIGDAVADGAAVGRERGDGRGNRRRRVDGDAQRARGHAGIAGGIGGGGGQAVGAVGKRRGREAPGAGAVGGGAAEQRRAVVDLDRAVGFRRAGQRQRIVIGDAIADGAAVGRERGDAGATGAVVSTVTLSAVEATLVLPASIGGGGGQAVGTIGSAAVVIAPGARPVRGGGAQQRGAVIDLDGALASAVPVSVRILSLVMPSPTVPLSVRTS